MASYTIDEATPSITPTLSGTTADTVTGDGLSQAVRITNLGIDPLKHWRIVLGHNPNTIGVLRFAIRIWQGGFDVRTLHWSMFAYRRAKEGRPEG